MIRSALFLVLLAAAGAVQAQQYRWVDRDGKVRYTDTPPPAWAKDVRKNNPANAPASGAAVQPAAAPLPFVLAELQKNFPVTLYTAPICKEPCTRARDALNKRGVPFTEAQVWNQETLDALKKLTGDDNVPALVVGRSAYSGFDPGKFDGLLDSAGYPKAGAYPARAQAAPAPPEGYEPPPVAEPVQAQVQAKPAGKAGPYDPSGLTGPDPKPGPYDPSGLQGPAPKTGPYGVPGPGK